MPLSACSWATAHVKNVADDSWAEGSINYSNRPPMGSVVTTFTVGATDNWTEVNVTSAVAASTGSILSR
jgi:hypothetical protein